MEYLLDTNALIRHFAQISKLGKKAKKIIAQGEKNQHQLFISIISLMEIMYLAEKNRIPLTLNEMLNNINSKKCYSIVEFDVEILKKAASFHFYELHDRLILATAMVLGTPVVSSDGKFQEVEDIEVLW
ncbi:MAG: type II toxin-antitoxin system VapC family toxin [Candidatus Aminicenantes bacterium]|nr:type II toxin-antitoxin system VapC family toxin [Candidatus Aminicenantes bacterium]